MRLIRLWFTDVLGQLKSFAISPAELENAFEEGMTLRRLVHRRLLPGAGERRARPARPQQLRAAAVGRPDDARGPDVLRHLQPRRHARSRATPARCCAATSTGPASGASRSTSRPRWSSSTSPPATRRPARSRSTPARYFDLTTADVAGDLRKRTIQTLEAMGIPVEYSFHEDSPSQHEIDLRYTDALTMADSVMTFRLVVREVGLRARACTPRSCPSRSRACRARACTPTCACSRATTNAFHDPGDPYGLSKVGQGLHRRPAASTPARSPPSPTSW